MAGAAGLALACAPVGFDPGASRPGAGVRGMGDWTLEGLRIAAAQAHQDAAHGCIDRETGSQVPGVAWGGTGASDYSKGVTFQASDGFYANFQDPVAGIGRPIEGSAWYHLPAQASPQQGVDPQAVQGSHAPQPINGANGAVLVWDSDNVLRAVSGTVQEPAFAQPGYDNNGFAAISPTLLSCLGGDNYFQLNYNKITTVNYGNSTSTTDDSGTSWYTDCCYTLNDGDSPHNNGIYVSDSSLGLHRYGADKVQVLGDTQMGLNLALAWEAAEPTGNYGNFPDQNGNANAMPGAPSAATNLPPTSAMLAQVQAEYLQGGFDITKILARHVMVAESFHRSDVELPGTGTNASSAGLEIQLQMVDQNKNPGYLFDYWQYNAYYYQGTINFASQGGQTAETAQAERANDYPVGDLGPGPSYPKLAISSWLPDTVSKITLQCYAPGQTQGQTGYTGFDALQSAPAWHWAEAWIADGTGTELCDPAMMASNALVAQAPHSFDGVYCAALGPASAPLLAQATPMTITVDNPTGTDGAGHAHMGPAFGFTRAPEPTSGGANVFNGDSSLPDPF